MKIKPMNIFLAAMLMMLAVGIASAVTLPTADFTGSPDIGSEDLVVTFTATTAGMTPPLVYEWDWGDNSGKSTGTSTTTHTYTNPGKYTVKLIVTDYSTGGLQWISVTKTDYIHVTHVPPVASFAYITNDPPAAPLEVTFDSTATTGEEITYSWDFGDGGATDIANPVHAYTAKGTYTVVLNVTNDGGSSEYSKDITVLPEVPLAMFTASSPTSGQVPLAVQFQDQSVGEGIAGWSWDFGDGGISTQPNPLYAYGAVGIYDVTLTVTSPSGSNTSVRTAFINVTEATGPVICPTPEPTPEPTPCPVIPAIPKQDNVTVFREGVWFLDTTFTGAIAKTYHFGLSGDTPVKGDWNGDGKNEIGVFRAGKYWFLDYDGSGAWNGKTIDRLYTYGKPGDKIVKGDWNADGKDEIGIFRPSTGYWLLDYNGNGVWDGTTIDRGFRFGLDGDTPVIGI